MVYKFRNGHAIKNVDAEDVGRCLEELRAAGPSFTPQDVVEKARPEEAPLHPAFEWDDRIAGEKYRENQARSVIRSVVVVEMAGTPQQRESLACVSFASPFDKEGSSYGFCQDVLAEMDLRARVIAAQESQLQGWVQRNAHIVELAEYVDAIRAAAAQRAADAARQEQERPAPEHRTRRRRLERPAAVV